jgi:hypothetical protein
MEREYSVEGRFEREVGHHGGVQVETVDRINTS